MPTFQTLSYAVKHAVISGFRVNHAAPNRHIWLLRSRSINPKYIDKNGGIRLAELFRDVFGACSWLNHRDLEKRTMELLPTTSFKLFNQLRNTAIDEHIIVRHEGSFSRYTLTGQELPFPGNS